MRNFGHGICAAIVLAISASGCARATAATGGGAGVEPPTAIVVENNNWADMTVYVERSGARTRLGTVTAANRRVFRLPRVLAGVAATFRLIADPIGGREVFVTAPVQAVPGQMVNFNIENHVNVSTVWVSNR